MRIPVAVRGHAIDLLVDDHVLGEMIRTGLSSANHLAADNAATTPIATDLETVRTPVDVADDDTGPAADLRDANDECGDLEDADAQSAETVGFVVQGAADNDQPKLLIARSGRVLARVRTGDDLVPAIVSVLDSYDISAGLPKFGFRVLRGPGGRCLVVDAVLAPMLQRIERRLNDADVQVVPAAEIAVTEAGGVEVAGTALTPIGVLGQIWHPQALADLENEPLSPLAWVAARASWYDDPQQALDHAEALLQEAPLVLVAPNSEPAELVEKVSALFDA
jgi:hypothetical protein